MPLLDDFWWNDKYVFFSSDYPLIEEPTHCPEKYTSSPLRPRVIYTQSQFD